MLMERLVEKATTVAAATNTEPAMIPRTEGETLTFFSEPNLFLTVKEVRITPKCNLITFDKNVNTC